MRSVSAGLRNKPMSENETPTAEASPRTNMTRAGVLGKVPQFGKSRGRGRKVGKLSRHQKQHVNQLKARGVISDRAAARHGL